MNKRILLLGATGYLGKYLYRRFFNEGYEVFCLIRESSNTNELLSIDPKTSFVKAPNLKELPKLDFLVHVATSYGRKGENREEIFSANVDLPLQVLKSVVHKDLVFINTDTSLPENLSDYAESKASFLKVLKEQFLGKKIINIELEQFYGPIDHSFLGFVKRNLENDIAIELTDGIQKRDFIYIDDVVEAYSLVLKKEDSIRREFQSFSLGSGTSYRVKDVVEKLCQLMNKSPNLLKWGAREKRVGEPDDLVADITSLKQLGFIPKVSLQEGLERVING